MSCDSDSGQAGPTRKMKPYSREDEDLDHVSESNYDSSDGHKSMQLKPCNLSVSGGDVSDNEADQPTRRSEIKLEALLELNVGLNLISKPHSNDDNNNASYATTSNNNVNDSNNNNQQIKCENSKQGGRKLFECDVCNMKFSNGANMRRHKMRHTGVKPYECRVCQKRFFRKDHLAEHFTTHTKTLPYHCPICNRGFQRQIAMRAHFQNEHVGQHEMVKTCPLCSYRAGTMKSLRVHFFNRHGIDLDNPGSGTSSSLLLALEQSNSTHLLPALAAAAAASGSNNNNNNNSNNNYSDSGESARSTENATPPMHFLTPHVEISMTDNDNPVRMNSESNSQSQSGSVTATTSSGLDIHAIVRPIQKGSPASPQSADSNSNIPSSSHSSILASAVSSRHHMFENSITPSISLIPIKQEPNTNDGYSSDSNSKSNQRSLTSTPMLSEPSQGPLNCNVSNSTAESVTPTSSLASMIKVSPLKSLLREDLKRRITARANNRVARNLNHLATQLSSSTSVCNSSNSLSTLTVMPEAPVVATSTNGTITSTGADNEMMAASSSKRKNLQCLYCGIEFPDQTLYFLHKGCHSDTNPWKCNICGDVCQNVYEFNSHLLSKSHQ